MTAEKIDSTALQYAPQVLAGVTSIEATAAELPGETKKQIVINSVLAGAHVAEGIPLPQVAAVGALVDLFVSILKTSGWFKSKPKTPPPVKAPPAKLKAA